ncbi:MAG: YncE family protein [Woeseiaceae bacterium]|nr:YncE family protein [Woeseiaceae bacterium]
MHKKFPFSQAAIAILVIFLEGTCIAQVGGDEQTYVFVAGRRLPYLYAISLADAMKPENDLTANAIISRSKVALERLDGRLLGDPANLILSEDGNTVYVVNHHGSIDNAEFTQHGGRGQIAVLDVDAVIDPRNDKTHNALLRHMDSGGFGAIGVALLADMLVISNAESYLAEDGGNRVTFVDRRTGSLRGAVELGLGSPGFECDYPVPYVAPFGPPRNVAVLAPDPGWGCFPNPNGLAIGRAANGKEYVFTANGGTDDVSVIDLAQALEGERLAEIARIPIRIAPWGMAATPDGRHIVVASGGSQKDDSAGNTISIIDVDRAASGAADAVVARVRVGTADPDQPTLPLIVSVTPDGQEIIVPNILVDNVSIVNFERALAGDPNAEVVRIPLVRADGRTARPKGSTVTADGRYALISGGPRVEPLSQETGYVYVIDLALRRIVGTVTGVGNDPYGLVTVTR